MGRRVRGEPVANAKGMNLDRRSERDEDAEGWDDGDAWEAVELDDAAEEAAETSHEALDGRHASVLLGLPGCEGPWC